MTDNNWNLSFISDDWTHECCPNCASEVEIKCTGKSVCSECGHKDVLPCNICYEMNDYLCDWNDQTRCTPFPKDT
jgi:hypothetical protein